MRTTARPALVASALLISACFHDVESSDTVSSDTTSETGNGDGDGDPAGDGDGDGDPTGDGDGEPTGDGDGEPGDGDGDPGCQPGDCGDNQYCIAGVCETPPNGMAAVESGTFWMGCNEEIDVECNDDEYPYHEVDLSAFAIDRTEVTADAYAECVNQGECTAPVAMAGNQVCDQTDGMQPVVCVTWFQARDFCEWSGKQLPTEAQWEKAARGDDGRMYPWGNQPPTCTLASMGNCGVMEYEPVGSHPAGASPYGVLDMAGSTMEWIADWYSTSYYVESPQSDPTGPASGTFRVARSSSPINLAPEMRTSLRYPDFFNMIPPDEGFELIGFRCVYVP